MEDNLLVNISSDYLLITLLLLMLSMITFSTYISPDNCCQQNPALQDQLQLHHGIVLGSNLGSNLIARLNLF